MSSCNLYPLKYYITSAAHLLPIGRRADCSFGVGNSGGGAGIAAGLTSAAAAGAGRHHSPAVKQTTAGIPASNKNAEADQETARPLANFHPTVWGDFFIQNLSSPSDQINQIDHAQVQQRVETLKEQVRTMFSTSSSSTTTTALEEEMKLVDALQRLGLAYHFQKEISEALARMNHASDQHSTVADHSEDLRVVSLRFRLLRQGGYNVSSNEFNKFKDADGHFKGSLRFDVEGLLSLYEASNCLGTREEDGILEEAMSFCRRELESMLDRLQPPLAAEVVRALDMPLVRRIERLEAREYLSFYEATTEGRDDVILELAKLDFNYVQSLHQEEIRELTRWWKELGLIKELSFARDRLVEGYSWSLMQYEPHLAHVRMMMTKIFCLISILDDIYDSYGTLEELRLLTDVMQSWDIGEVEVLPEYMKIYFMALYDLIKEFEQKYYHAQHLKEACAAQSKLYLEEAEWCNEGHTPAFRDHLQVTERSSGVRFLTCGFFVCMGGDNINIAAQEYVFDWLANNPKIVEASSTLGRLLGDISAYEVEEKRKHVASTVRCYMKEHGVSKETAHQKLREMGETAWKVMNEEWIKPSGIPTQLLAIPFDLARMVEMYYKGGDGYTNPFGKTKGIINLLLVKPVPL